MPPGGDINRKQIKSTCKAFHGRMSEVVMSLPPISEYSNPQPFTVEPVEVSYVQIDDAGQKLRTQQYTTPALHMRKETARVKNKCVERAAWELVALT